jgi:hypothetical protein
MTRQHGGAKRLVAVIALATTVAACSGGSSKSASSSSSSSSPSSQASSTSAKKATTTSRQPPTTLTTGAANLGAPIVVVAKGSSALGSGDLPPDIRAQIVKAVQAYENAATGTPLGTGKKANINGLLTTSALSHLTAQRRQALVDEGIPALAGVKASHSNVSLDGFLGPDHLWVVNANIDLQVSASTPGGTPAGLKRTGVLTFVNDAGAWKIDAFNVSVEREIP